MLSAHIFYLGLPSCTLLRETLVSSNLFMGACSIILQPEVAISKFTQAWAKLEASSASCELGKHLPTTPSNTISQASISQNRRSATVNLVWNASSVIGLQLSDCAHAVKLLRCCLVICVLKSLIADGLCLTKIFPCALRRPVEAIFFPSLPCMSIQYHDCVYYHFS